MIINFEFDTEFGKFADAISLMDGETAPSDAELETIKQQRLANWLAIVNPLVIPE